MSNYLRLNILADVHWESKIDRVLNELSSFGYRQTFESKDYGAGLKGITVLFICQDVALNLKRRIRLSKKEMKLYMDIMLDLEAMKSASPEERKREVAQRLFNEVPEILGGYKIVDFNRDAFVADLRMWIDGIGWRQQGIRDK